MPHTISAAFGSAVPICDPPMTITDAPAKDRTEICRRPRSWLSRFAPLLAILTGVLLASCNQDATTPKPSAELPVLGPDGTGTKKSSYSNAPVEFLDVAPANAEPRNDFKELQLSDTDGNLKSLSEYLKGKPLVVIVTRGATEPICPYCSTQTSQYIQHYPEIEALGAEVLLIYPLRHLDDKGRLNEFLLNAKGRLSDLRRPVPFPVVFDIQLNLVSELGIAGDLAKPATYILTADGRPHYAYVGTGLADRPSFKVVLEQLQKLVSNTHGSTE